MEHPLAAIADFGIKSCKLLFYDPNQAAKIGILASLNFAPGLDLTIRIIGVVITFIVAMHTMYTNHKRLEMDRKRLEHDLNSKSNTDGKHQHQQLEKSSS